MMCIIIPFFKLDFKLNMGSPSIGLMDCSSDTYNVGFFLISQQFMAVVR